MTARFPVGQRVVSTWNPHSNMRGEVVGHGEILDVDDRMHRVYLVKLDQRMEDRSHGFQTIIIFAMRADRAERLAP